MKKNISLLIILFAFTYSYSQQADLFFSEYVEGSSNNKAIEIYNGTGATVNLDNYQIAQTTNGSDWTYFHIFPSGATLASGAVWVIIADQFDNSLFNHANADEVLAYPSIVHFNGNDARALIKIDGSNTIFLDYIGVPNLDPGNGWDVAGVAEATKDHTIVRKSTVLQGNTNWSLSAGTEAANSEWIVYSQNTVSYLGSHQAGSNMLPVVDNILTISETFVIEAPTEYVGFYIGASISDLDGTITSAQLSWGTDGINFPNQIMMDTFSLVAGLPADFYCTYPTLIPVQLEGTIIYYQIVAIDDEADTTNFSGSFTVLNVSGTTPIYNIQFTTDSSGDSPLVGSTVTTSGIVTAVESNGYFLQDGTGAWSGIYVYDSNYSVNIGDDITITCEVFEYYNLTELKNITNFTLNSQNNTLPAVSIVAPSNFSEEYEGVLIKTENVICTNDSLGYGEWEITDGTYIGVVDDLFFLYTPAIGSTYNLTGVLHFTYNSFKIEPRNNNDIEIVSFPGGQNISLNLGWNIISTYIDPTNPSLDSVFSEIIYSIELVKNYLGIAFWPFYGVNDIGSFTIGQGYQVKTNTTDTLTVIGSEIVPQQTPIAVLEGWSIIGYLRKNAEPIDLMLNTIGPNIIIVKDQNANVYWPQYGLNNIGDMQPSLGYQIKMNIADTLVYPANISAVPANFVNIPAGIYPIYYTNVTLSSYNISKYEVTHSEYIAFLNAINCNADGSYNDAAYGNIEYIDMDDVDCAIDHNGSSFYFIGSTYATAANCPVIEVTWHGA
ncbi:MAG: hypothetical protein HN704_14425, partial [Bacteroidetes bacterium]|nr:hypothetical protein [Bacteroidota bacterium]